VKVEVHDRLEAVGAAAWDQLLATSPSRSPFLTWSWQEQWVQVFAAGRRLDLRRVVDDDGRLVGVLPLYEAEPGLFRIVGGVDVSDYLDLVVEPGREEEAWTALLQSRSTSAVVWDLHAVPAASATVALLPRLARAHGLSASGAVEERCPVLSLPSSWDAYLAALPGKHRHELNRKLRRLQREAADARIVCLRARNEIEPRLGDFLELHRRSRAGKARFMDARMEAFFRGVAAVFADHGALGLWFLDVGGAAVASFITLEWDATVGLYNSGFEPARASLSPGVILLARVIEDAIDRGKERFDFLRGEERYKYEFGPSPEDVWNIRIAPAELIDVGGSAAAPPDTPQRSASVPT
jgi:CelD/BcsL family acetyltransferase involved in cellulose biosynthesis